MDYPGLREKLTSFVALVDEIGGYKWGGSAEFKRVQGELHRHEPGVRKILNSLEPRLGDFSRSFPKGWAQAREACMKGVGLCDESQEIDEMLKPDVPNLRVDRLHERIWAAAQPF